MLNLFVIFKGFAFQFTVYDFMFNETDETFDKYFEIVPAISDDLKAQSTKDPDFITPGSIVY